MKRVLPFGKKGKLQPRVIGPFEILQCIKNVTYRLGLPPKRSTVYDLFHVSMLQKYIPDPCHVVNYQSIDLQWGLNYDEVSMRIIN